MHIFELAGRSITRHLQHILFRLTDKIIDIFQFTVSPLDNPLRLTDQATQDRFIFNDLAVKRGMFNGWDRLTQLKEIFDTTCFF